MNGTFAKCRLREATFYRNHSWCECVYVTLAQSQHLCVRNTSMGHFSSRNSCAKHGHDKQGRTIEHVSHNCRQHVSCPPEKASVVMQRRSYPTETVLSNKNRLVLSFKDSPRKPLGRRPRIQSVELRPPNQYSVSVLSASRPASGRPCWRSAPSPEYTLCQHTGWMDGPTVTLTHSIK